MTRPPRESRPLRITPRVLDLSLAAEYCSVSEDVIKRLLHAGHISVVRLPASRNPKRDHVRDLLFDRVELDEAIDRWKEKLVLRGEAA